MSDDSASTRGQRFERTIIPGTETLVTVQTEPHAVCFLSHDELDGQQMQLDADASGVLRFHVRSRADSEPVELRLEERGADGRTTVHTVAITSDPLHWEPAQEPTERETAGREARGQLVPALREDPRELTNAELISRDYPPRPHPQAPAARHARWRRLVSEDYLRVDPTRIEHPDVRFTRLTDPETVMSPTLPLPPPSERTIATELIRSILPFPRQIADSIFNGSSSTWSGAYLDQPINEFFLVEADWGVPRVFDSPVVYSAAAEWIGMGNSGSDLFQAGTDSECFNVFGMTITHYWMWIEALPYAPWAVPNFPVDPGDRISVTIFVADSYGNSWFQNATWGGLTPRDDSVWFMLYNRTKHLSYWGTYPTVDGGGKFRFKGDTAEFIIERPSSSRGGVFPLANFCVAAMRDCAYGDAQYGNKLFALEPDDGSQPFDGNLSYWNMDNPGTGHRLATAVSANDSTSYGGIDILWVFSNSL